MNSRQGLMAALEAKLDKKYRVIEPKVLDALEPKHPVVMVIRTNLVPNGTSGGLYRSSYAIWVIEPKTIDPEDDLDDCLDDVVTALDEYQFVIWTDAERSTYDEQPAYRITAQTLDRKVEN
jgi:hypothetical protein